MVIGLNTMSKEFGNKNNIGKIKTIKNKKRDKPLRVKIENKYVQQMSIELFSFRYLSIAR